MNTRKDLLSRRSTPRLEGFTLIELMITVAIVAILGTIAMTSYTSQIQKSRRTDARSAVMDLAGREEKLFSTVNAYSATPSDMGYGAPAAVWPITVGSGYYEVSVTVANPPIAYLVTATAIASQAHDTRCMTLSVDSLGSQTSTGTDTAASCWGN
jgi:type IV pilus assembly protein PilE